MASSTVDVVRSITTIVVLVNSAAGYGSGRLGEAKIPLCDIDLVHEQTTGLSAAKIEIRVAVKDFLGIPRNLREGPKTSMPVETGGFVLHSWTLVSKTDRKRVETGGFVLHSWTLVSK